MLGKNHRVLVSVLVTLVGFVFVSLRLTVRYYIKPPRRKPAAFIFGDILMIFGFLCTLMFAAMDIHMCLNAIHDHHNTEHGMIAWMKYLNSAGPFMFHQYWVALCGLYAIKASFLCYYYDAAEVLSKKLYYWLLTVSVITVMMFLLVLGYIMGRCHPISRYWVIASNNCFVVDGQRQLIINSVANLVSDVAIMIMGYCTILHSDSMGAAQTRTRMWFLAVGFISFLGFLTLIINCIRFSCTMQVTNKITGEPSPMRYIENMNGPKLAEFITLATLGEMNLTLVAISMPSFRVWCRLLTEAPLGIGVKRSISAPYRLETSPPDANTLEFGTRRNAPSSPFPLSPSLPPMSMRLSLPMSLPTTMRLSFPASAFEGRERRRNSEEGLGELLSSEAGRAKLAEFLVIREKIEHAATQ